MKIIMNYDKAFTHGGIFHADDVFSAALLRMMNPDIFIERGNQVPDGYDGLVFDIGGGAFDHHQEDRRVRKNGIPFAAFGLLWEKYGENFLESEEDRTDFDEKFVQKLDESDNTGEPNMIAECVAEFNPDWLEPDCNRDERFFEAVEFAQAILERKFKQIQAKRQAYTVVQGYLEKSRDGIMIMDRAVPWKKALKNTDIYYVIFPSIRGGYMVQAVPQDESESGRELKKPLPEKWRGKTAEELAELTGIAGFTFCHLSGFICAVKELDEAVRVAELTMKMEENE